MMYFLNVIFIILLNLILCDAEAEAMFWLPFVVALVVYAFNKSVSF